MKACLYVPGVGNDCSIPDCCVPGKSTSIADIIERFVFDPNVVTKSDGVYDESDEYEDDETREPGFDFSDAYRLKEKLENRKQNNIDVIDDSEVADVSAETETVKQTNQTEERSSSEGSQSASSEAS